MDSKRKILCYLKRVVTTLCLLAIFSPLITSGLEVRAASTAAVSVGQVTARQGENVVVPILLESNPGIAGMVLNIEYDASRLRIGNPNSIMQGMALFGLSFINVNNDTYSQNPFRVLWFGASNNTSTGELINIEFTVLQNALAGEAFVRVSVSADDVVDLDTNPVSLTIQQGSVTVTGAAGNQGAPGSATQPLQPQQQPQQQPTQQQPPPTQQPPPAGQAQGSSQQQNAQQTTATAVTPANLPTNVQTAVGNNQVFMAEATDEERTRELMSIPHSRAAGTAPESLVAYHVDSDGEMSLVITSLYDEIHSAIRLLGYMGELYTIRAGSIDFQDVSSAAWYNRATTFVSSRGLFAGVGEGRFAPQTTMTRGMFVSVLSRLEGIDPSNYNTSPFSDVSIEQWFGPAIVWAAEENIINQGILAGGAPGTFRPNDNISREEMAVLFANYLAIRDFPIAVAAVQPFYDIDEASEWARDAIHTMRSHSIIHGTGNNRYNPQGHATRAEVAQIFTSLVRAIVGLN